MTPQDIEQIITEAKVQELINAQEFYFRKGQEALQKWLALDIEPQAAQLIVERSGDYKEFQTEAATNADFRATADLLFEVVAYCDRKAREKEKYNQYEDKRTLAEASVRMGNWIKQLVDFRFNRNTLKRGSPLNAFNYLLDPANNTTALSENHRELIAENLLNREYDPDTFISDLKAYFAPYGLQTKNADNYTQLLTRIIYSRQQDWKEEVVGLMAADSTGWQEDVIEEMEGHDSCIVWNSKRPSGGNRTIKFLRNRIDDGQTFNIYYSSGGKVNYRATIVDIAESQKELDEKNWSKDRKIYGFHTAFEEYKDQRFAARIVFLASRLEKLNPVAVDQFEFFEDYSAPRHDNLSPIKTEPAVENIHGISQAQYTIEEFERLFIEYLNRVIPGSTDVYKSSMSTMTRLLVQSQTVRSSFYEVQTPAMLSGAEDALNADAEYIRLNTTGNNRLSSALRHFRNFVTEINGSRLKTSTGMNDSVRKALNLILFGPPGTGKTYTSIRRALEIIDDHDVRRLNWNDRAAAKKLFDKKLLEGQIVFTTFHQSMSYEDFIEGIKPLEPKIEGQSITYKVVNGILKEFCAQIRSNDRLTEARPTVHPVSSFDQLYSAFLSQLQSMLNEQEHGEYLSLPSRRSNVKVLKIEGDSIVTIGETASSVETIQKEKLKRIYEKYGGPDDIKKIMDLRTEIGTDIGWITNYYALYKALKDFEHSLSVTAAESKTAALPNKYVLIIDEINRGNVSQIFGELITLLEEDKRENMPEALEVMLPYSKTKFSVPSNLYIIGTMNTADRSVESLDTALRRRFTFEEMPPKYDLNELGYALHGFTAAEILKTINIRLEKLIDKDHRIGHSYFLLRKNETAEQKISEALYKNIIPLLQEYFFGDFAKIGLVLGQGFVKQKVTGNKENVFADFEHSGAENFNAREVYEIVDYRNEDHHHQVKGQNMTFESALKLLMKR